MTTELLAQAATQSGGAAPPPQQPQLLEMMFPLLMIGVIFWLLVFRPRSTEQKKYKELMSALKKGDRVMTIGGIFGTVVGIKDDEVTLKVDESNNTKMTFARTAIKSILSGGTTPEKKDL